MGANPNTLQSTPALDSPGQGSTFLQIQMARGCCDASSALPDLAFRCILQGIPQENDQACVSPLDHAEDALAPTLNCMSFCHKQQIRTSKSGKVKFEATPSTWIIETDSLARAQAMQSTAHTVKSGK